MKLVEGPPPTVCSGCYAPGDPDKRYVDFESSWDGPVFQDKVATGDGGEVTNLAVSIDELILCEECLTAAANALGFVLPDEQTDKIGELEGQLDNLRDRVLERDQYAERLQAALALKPGAKLDRAVEDLKHERNVAELERAAGVTA